MCDVSLVRYKHKNVKTRFTHAELYKTIMENSIKSAFPKGDMAFNIFLTLVVTNCSAERSFLQLKLVKNPIRTSIEQDRHDTLLYHV